MELRKFEISITASMTAFGRVNLDSVAQDLETSCKHLLLEEVKVEVKEVDRTTA